MLQSLSSPASRTPSPGAAPADDAPLAVVVDLFPRRPRHEPAPVHITPALLAALGSTWVEDALRSR